MNELDYLEAFAESCSDAFESYGASDEVSRLLRFCMVANNQSDDGAECLLILGTFMPMSMSMPKHVS